MDKYLVLYRAPVSAREQMANSTPEQAEAGMAAWMAWQSRVSASIVDMGAPTGDPKTIGGRSSGGKSVGGYSIVQAADLAAAQKLFDGHPHLGMPGATIEIRELMALPGM